MSKGKIMSDVAFLLILGTYVFVGVAFVLFVFVFYAVLQTVHEMLHPTDAQLIAKAAMRSRDAGVPVRNWYSDAYAEAKRLGYAASKEFFTYWYKSCFGTDVWEQKVSFRQIFKSRLLAQFN